MTYSIHPEAKEEFKKAFVHYENNQEGLGNKFSDEFYAALNRILSFPHAWPVIDKEDRRMLLNTFPFSIIYSLNEDQNQCIIYAIMHHRQKPGYWKSRKD